MNSSYEDPVFALPKLKSEIFKCRGWDSNPHGRAQRILSPPRLPFRHPGCGKVNLKPEAHGFQAQIQGVGGAEIEPEGGGKAEEKAEEGAKGAVVSHDEDVALPPPEAAEEGAGAEQEIRKPLSLREGDLGIAGEYRPGDLGERGLELGEGEALGEPEVHLSELRGEDQFGPLSVEEKAGRLNGSRKIAREGRGEGNSPDPLPHLQNLLNPLRREELSAPPLKPPLEIRSGPPMPYENKPRHTPPPKSK